MIKFKQLVGEKEVEHFWWDALKEYFPKSEILARDTSSKTDGLLIDEENKIRTLIEVKEDLDLKKSSEQAKLLIQSIFYIKQYEIKGEKLPKTVFAADKNEAFVVHTNALQKYLDYKVDWKTPASQAWKKYPEMLIDISNDQTINPFVFDIKEGFNFNSIKNKLCDLNQNVARLIKITDENLQNVFEYFCDNVLIKNKLSVNQQVNLFIDILINPSENYLHPKQKNTLHSKSLGFIKVDEKNFISFFSHFDGEQYTVREKEKMVSIIDRLIQDETRKRQGEFFTPTIWVNEAHKMISETFGEDWKEKYIVWDNSCGTCNLTRDYKFKELYCSTLHKSDIETANQMKINPEAVKFQFDFLNDDLELLKEPDYAPGLWKALQEGKEILFLINPPYGTANEAGAKGEQKAGIALTKMNEEMKKDDWGASSQQLYAQFLYRISKIKNSKIAIFHKSIHFSGTSYKKFRHKFFRTFNYVDGMLFQASHFDSVSDAWGIDFAIYNNETCIDKMNFIHKIKDLDENLNVITISNKNIYNLDNENTFSDWIKRNTKKEKTFDAPQMSSALSLKTKGIGQLSNKSLGYYFNIGNNVMKNNQEVYILSSSASSGHGISILPINYLDVVSNFTARKTISGNYANWINDKDEYIAPTEAVQSSPEYIQWNNDAIVYSLFNTSSNQSSMRQVEYKDKLWDIKFDFNNDKEKEKFIEKNPLVLDKLRTINEFIDDYIIKHKQKPLKKMFIKYILHQKRLICLSHVILILRS